MEGTGNDYYHHHADSMYSRRVTMSVHARADLQGVEDVGANSHSPTLMKMVAERQQGRRRSSRDSGPRRRPSEDLMRPNRSFTAATAAHFVPPATAPDAAGAGGAASPSNTASKKGEKRRPAVSRRLRRALNDMYLQKCALRVRHDRGDSLDLYDPEELKQLFSVSYTSAFNDLHDSQTASASFAPFLNVTEEEQGQMLSDLHSASKRQDAAQRSKQQNPRAAPYRFAMVSRKAQSVMLAKIESCEENLRTLESLVSKASLVPDSRTPVEMESSYERMLLHGLAQYYFMRSTTRSHGPHGQRSITLLSSTPQSTSSTPECSLVDYLLHRGVR